MATLGQMAGGGRVADRAARSANDPRNYFAEASQFNSYDDPHKYAFLNATGGAKQMAAILKQNPNAFGTGPNAFGDFQQRVGVNGGNALNYNPATKTFAGDAGGTAPDNASADYMGQAQPVAPAGDISPSSGTTPVADSFGSGTTQDAGTAAPGRMYAGGPGFNEAMGNYTGGQSMGDYVNPMAQWATDQGLNAVKSSYAGAGNFLSGPAMKGISDYASSSGLNQAWQPAFNNYMADKNFNYGVDNADRNFNYNAQTGDRNFNYNTLRDLSQLGMQGTQGAAQGNNMLAAIQAQLAQAGGQAQGSGTMGQGNALTNAISQILSGLGQQNTLNTVFPKS